MAVIYICEWGKIYAEDSVFLIMSCSRVASLVTKRFIVACLLFCCPACTARYTSVMQRRHRGDTLGTQHECCASELLFLRHVTRDRWPYMSRSSTSTHIRMYCTKLMI